MSTSTLRRLGASLALAAFLPACAGTGGGWSAGDRAFSQERLDRIGAVMRAEVDKGTFPGAVSVVAHRGRVVHEQAHGFLDAARTRPMPVDAIFRMASMTKPLTSVATMMLVEEGRLQLNDPIARLLPELKDLKVETPQGDVAPVRPPTIHDLLRHTAGFVYGGSTRSARIRQAYAEQNIEARETPLASGEMLRRLGAIPLAHQPGTFWEYSIATDVLGLLLERATGERLDALLARMLTTPLGMVDTAWWVEPAKRARLAEALDADPLKAPFLKAYRQFEAPSGLDHLKGGAGMVGTARDYLRFLQMLANGGELDGRRYLSRKTVEFMFADHAVGMGGTTVASTGTGYGFGLGFATRLADGMGWTPGSPGDVMWAGAWGTSFWIDPKERLVGILMSQGPSTRVHSRMLYKNLVYGALVE